MYAKLARAASENRRPFPSNLRRNEVRRFYSLKYGLLDVKDCDEEAEKDLGVDFLRLPARELGERLGMTIAMRDLLKIRTIQPADVSAAEWACIVKERRRARDGARKRRRRYFIPKKVAPMKPLSARAQVMRDETTTEWRSLADIGKVLVKGAAFRKPNKRALRGVGLRVAMHRALQELGDQIDHKIEAGPRGNPMKFVRLQLAEKPLPECNGNKNHVRQLDAPNQINDLADRETGQESPVRSSFFSSYRRTHETSQNLPEQGASEEAELQGEATSGDVSSRSREARAPAT